MQCRPGRKGDKAGRRFCRRIQSFRNFGVSIRPVGDEELDVVLLKGPLHVFSIKYGQLVGLAGDAPRGGEVDKDWASLIERSL